MLLNYINFLLYGVNRKNINWIAIAISLTKQKNVNEQKQIQVGLDCLKEVLLCLYFIFGG